MSDPNSLSENMGKDLDSIAKWSNQALNKLAVEDVEGAERLVERIRDTSTSWEDPQ